jgi:hypothetical protein
MADTECTAEQFLKDAGTHTMEVLLDQGVNRHLCFSTNGSSVYHFGIVTWPQFLCIYGDMGCYVFQRTEDMLTFFRGKPDELKINPGYWSEKLQADAHHEGVTEYSRELFARQIKRLFEERFDDIDADNAEEIARRDRIWKAIEEEVLLDPEFELEARDLADDFECDGFRFSDFWEINLQEYTFHFIWCLFAIVHGIRLYDKAKAESAVPA